MNPNEAQGRLPALLTEEYRSLRQEILVRVAIQNLVLVGVLAMFAVVAVTIPAARQRADWLVASHAAVTLGAGLIWVHNGSRTIQIRGYFTSVLEPRLFGSEAGWESWLRRNPFGGFLGSRWFISTKGVFLGSQLGVLLEAGLIDTPVPNSLLRLVALGTVVATAVLLSHPKLPANQTQTLRSDGGRQP